MPQDATDYPIAGCTQYRHSITHLFDFVNTFMNFFKINVFFRKMGLFTLPEKGNHAFAQNKGEYLCKTEKNDDRIDTGALFLLYLSYGKCLFRED